MAKQLQEVISDEKKIPGNNVGNQILNNVNKNTQSTPTKFDNGNISIEGLSNKTIQNDTTNTTIQKDNLEGINNTNNIKTPTNIETNTETKSIDNTVSNAPTKTTYTEKSVGQTILQNTSNEIQLGSNDPILKLKYKELDKIKEKISEYDKLVDISPDLDNLNNKINNSINGLINGIGNLDKDDFKVQIEGEINKVLEGFTDLKKDQVNKISDQFTDYKKAYKSITGNDADALKSLGTYASIQDEVLLGLNAIETVKNNTVVAMNDTINSYYANLQNNINAKNGIMELLVKQKQSLLQEDEYRRDEKQEKIKSLEDEYNSITKSISLVEQDIKVKIGVVSEFSYLKTKADQLFGANTTLSGLNSEELVVQINQYGASINKALANEYINSEDKEYLGQLKSSLANLRSVTKTVDSTLNNRVDKYISQYMNTKDGNLDEAAIAAISTKLYGDLKTVVSGDDMKNVKNDFGSFVKKRVDFILKDKLTTPTIDFTTTAINNNYEVSFDSDDIIKDKGKYAITNSINDDNTYAFIKKIAETSLNDKLVLDKDEFEKNNTELIKGLSNDQYIQYLTLTNIGADSDYKEDITKVIEDFQIYTKKEYGTKLSEKTDTTNINMKTMFNNYINDIDSKKYNDFVENIIDEFPDEIGEDNTINMGIIEDTILKSLEEQYYNVISESIQNDYYNKAETLKTIFKKQISNTNTYGTGNVLINNTNNTNENTDNKKENDNKLILNYDF